MSSVVQSSAGSELQYIYTILRKLNHIRRAELKSSPLPSAFSFDDSLFPRKFLLKLIDERLSFLNDLATQLVTELFKQLSKDVKRTEQTKIQSYAPQRSELDEYFHQSFYHLHDFMIGLDWYESDIDDLSKSDFNYIRSKLIHVNNFLLFRKTLTKVDNTLISTDGEKNKTNLPAGQVLSPPLNRNAIKTIKPNISSKKTKLDSPRRRVRFSDSTKDGDQDDEISPHTRDSHEQSVLALDLLIYALNLFVRVLYKQFLDRADSSAVRLTESLDLLKESRRKLRTSQLMSISRQIKYSNDIYLTVLSYLHDVKNIYLKDYVLSIICAGDSERSLKLYKSPRIKIFLEVIGMEVESKIISSLANQCLQLLLDLITSEINLPPVELESETKTKLRKEVARSRENYLNFIASWLNLDEAIFGLTRPGKEQGAQNTGTELMQPHHEALKTSTLASGGLFKSSSRILAQMENLNEFMRNIFIQVGDRIRSQQQLTYFLRLIYAGINQSFELIEPQLVNQLNTVTNNSKKFNSTLLTDDLESISNSVNLITVRIRCLKLIQILSSLDNQIKDVLNLDEDSLETKLNQFARYVDH